MSLFIEILPKRAQLYLDIVTSTLLILFSIILVWKGGQNALIAYQSDYHSSSLLHVPLWITYSIVPIGALFLGLQYILKIGDSIKILSKPEDNSGKKRMQRSK